MRLEDKNQKYWQLALIQSSSVGVSTVVFGAQMSAKYGAGSAVVSICIGNFILWILGLAIVAMAYSERKNAIENLVDYIGKWGSIIGGIVLIVIFLMWYPLHLQSTVTELRFSFSNFYRIDEGYFLRLGAGLGLIIALLSIGGIKLIKWFCIICFLPIILYVLYCMIRTDSFPKFAGTWGVSLSSVAFTVSIFLSGTVNLPTFFRHARSRPDAFFALSLLVVFYSFFELSGVIINGDLSTSAGFFNYLITNRLNLWLLASYFVVSLICVNIVNIYFASAVWELLLPQRMQGAKGYAIVGMAGTIIYTLIQVWAPLILITNLVNSFIANLGVTILIAFLVRRVVYHRIRGYEKALNFLCWIIGCIASFTVHHTNGLGGELSFADMMFPGMGACALSFLVILLIEETIWSIKHSLPTKMKNTGE